MVALTFNSMNSIVLDPNQNIFQELFATYCHYEDLPEYPIEPYVGSASAAITENQLNHSMSPIVRFQPSAGLSISTSDEFGLGENSTITDNAALETEERNMALQRRRFKNRKSA